MSKDKPIDSLKNDAQNESWAKRAEHWRKVAPKGAASDDTPNQALIKFACIAAGDRVLDLASGTGDPAMSLALAVGDQGVVVASDANMGMLNGARDRAANLGLSNLSFETAPMETLPFADATFDAVTCRFGLMHAGDPLAGLSEARRVLKPGRKAAFMVHGPPELNTQWTVLHQCVQSYLAIEDQARFDKHYKFSGEGELAAVFSEAGFTSIEHELAVTTVTHEGGASFWDASLVRSLGSRVEGLDASEMAALNAIISEAFAPYLDNGNYALKSSNRIASGTA